MTPKEREVMKLALEALTIQSDRVTEIGKKREAITAIKEALAQTEQEPVATLDDLEQEIYENTRQFVSRDVMEWMLKRYYTTPPQRTWVGLTDEERKDLCRWWSSPMDAIYATEAKLKEKNTRNGGCL